MHCGISRENEVGELWQRPGAEAAEAKEVLWRSHGGPTRAPKSWTSKSVRTMEARATEVENGREAKAVEEGRQRRWHPCGRQRATIAEEPQ